VEEEMSRRKIPRIDSIRELATFWDTHDLTDFEEQLEEATGTAFERPAGSVAVPLQPKEIEAVKRIADSKGIGYDALIREWVLEKLHTS
jgi:predicted DNA binding CopG/RHH family protein